VEASSAVAFVFFAGLWPAGRSSIAGLPLPTPLRLWRCWMTWRNKDKGEEKRCVLYRLRQVFRQLVAACDLADAEKQSREKAGVVVDQQTYTPITGPRRFCPCLLQVRA